MAIDRSVELENMAGICSKLTSKVEKQVAASLHSRQRKLSRDDSSCADPNLTLRSEIH